MECTLGNRWPCLSSSKYSNVRTYFTAPRHFFVAVMPNRLCPMADFPQPVSSAACAATKSGFSPVSSQEAAMSGQ